ncbi:MAG TPA: MFS transporter [Gemmatimonadaceae bacterium]|jgi:EmrB/QacA subfamily drug resistance transporter
MTSTKNASHKRWALIATIIASSMTFIDGTVVNVALPALQSSLNATITDVQWVVEAYALFLGALILVGGSLGDQLGRKKVFLFGVIWFTAASVLCGFAPNPLILIGGRALQGIGAAFLVPGSLAIISATYDDAERGRAIGTWSGFSAITTAIGPVIGGWLVEHVSGRAAFFINVPLAVAVVMLSLAFVDESKDPSRGKTFDFVGVLAAVVGLSGVVLGLLEWPPLGATHPLVLGSLAIGVIALVLLPVIESHRDDPMLPLGPFKSRAFSLANVLTLFLYGALGLMMFLLPMNLIQVQGFTPTAAGAALVPFAVIMFALSRWSGGLVERVGSRLPLTVGPAVTAVGFFLLARSGVGHSYWSAFFPGIVVMGVGMTITVAPLTTTVMGAVDQRHAGVASGVNNAVSRIAGLLAIAVFGVVLTNRFESGLQPTLQKLDPSARAQLQTEIPKLAGAKVSDPQTRTAVHASFVGAYRLVMLEMVGLALLSAIAGAGIGETRKVKPTGESRSRQRA